MLDLIMEIIAVDTKPLEKKTNALCCFVHDNTKWVYNSNKIIDSTIKQSIKDTKWKVGTVRVIHTHKILNADRILLVGLGTRPPRSTGSRSPLPASSCWCCQIILISILFLLLSKAQSYRCILSLNIKNKSTKYLKFIY